MQLALISNLVFEFSGWDASYRSGLAFHSSAAAADCKQDHFLFSEAQHFYQSNQMLLSAVHFSPLRNSSCDAEIASRSWIGFSLAMNQLQEKSEALRAVEMATESSRVSGADKISLQMIKAWIRQEPGANLTSAQRSRWDLWTKRAEEAEFLALIERTDFADIKQMPKKERLLALETKLETTPRKSLLLSGISSAILPGAGQAYVGNWQAAGLSLVLNAIFLGATLEFARNNLTAAAIASGTVFSVTYIGNIASSVEGAQAVNRANRADTEMELRNTLLPELRF